MFIGPLKVLRSEAASMWPHNQHDMNGNSTETPYITNTGVRPLNKRHLVTGIEL